jgi:elongation factor Ts
MDITPSMVKELREKMGAGMMDCKKALQESDGDFEKAIEYLRKKGIASVAKRVGKEAKEGLIHSYIHPGGRLGVLVEVNCETDFVARTELFQNFVKEIAMQVAATNPLAVDREALSSTSIEKEKEIYREQALGQGKPEKLVDKIVEGKLVKYYQEVCLLEQPFIKDTDKYVQDILNDTAAQIGEHITVKRFVRFRLGE